jgi:hypothetical protein
MIVAAITALKQRGGSSRQAISKYIASNYKGVSDNNNAHLRLAIRRALASGMLIQATNHANTFRLSDAAKKPAAKPKKVVKKKPAAKKAKKPKTAVKKKTTTPKKKTAAKKKTPKKAKKPAAKKAVKKPAKKPAAKKVKRKTPKKAKKAAKK